MLLGETGPQREELIEQLRAVGRGERAEAGAADAVRRAIVETTLHDDRGRLLASLDEALLGLRPRPARYFSAGAFRHGSGTAA